MVVYYNIFSLVISVKNIKNLVSCLTYYYYGDSIKLYSISMLDWIRGRRPGEDPINPDNNRFTPWVDRFGLNRNNNNVLPISEILDDEAIQLDSAKIISDPATSQVDHYFKDKGKDTLKSPVLTSPSLENLNAQVAETWSRSDSPESTSSGGTVKPIIGASSNVTQDNFEVTNNPSSGILKPDAIPKSMVSDLPLVTELTTLMIPKFNWKNPINDKNWRANASKELLTKIVFIEEVFNS